jgi:hypothetical protein
VDFINAYDIILRNIEEAKWSIRENRIMAGSPIYQFYAELNDYKPKIWQCFQVASNITAARLGYILQVLFEMRASHLMAIEVPQGENYVVYQ